MYNLSYCDSIVKLVYYSADKESKYLDEWVLVLVLVYVVLFMSVDNIYCMYKEVMYVIVFISPTHALSVKTLHKHTKIVN